MYTKIQLQRIHASSDSNDGWHLRSVTGNHAKHTDGIHSHSPLSYKEMAWRPPCLTPIKDLEYEGSRDKIGPMQVILSP